MTLSLLRWRLFGGLAVCVLGACAEPVDDPPASVAVGTDERPEHASGGSVDAEQPTRPRVYAFDCQGQYVVAEFSNEHVWVFLPGATVKLPRLESASGARYGDHNVGFWSKGEEAMLEQQGATVNCRVDRRNTPFEAAKLDGADFRGLGNEPGWELLMYGDRIRFSWDYGNSQAEFPATPPVSNREEAWSRWSSTAAGRQIEIELRARPCHDSMSGDSFETTVTVALDGRQFHGCGRPLH